MQRALLSSKDRDAYAENGYVVVRGLLDREELEVWRDHFLRIIRGDVAVPEHMLVMKDVMVAKGAVAPATVEEAIAKLQDLEADETFFEGYLKHPKILDHVERFVGPNIKSIHSMFINKPPNVDGRHPPHQDLLYFPFRPADKIVAAWTAIDRCTPENGCLFVYPGTHQGELLEHGRPDWEWWNQAYFGVEGLSDSDRVELTMEPGDTVFFHPLLLHGSGQNRTPGFRKSISGHYASCECRYLDRATTSIPRRYYTLVRGSTIEGGI